MSGTLRIVGAVGWVTFREVLRDKILYNIILCAFLLFAVAFLASKIMVVRQDRVVTDFGLSAVNISCAMIAGLTGAAMLSREIERRTLLVAMSRPITRHQFIAGKFVGLAAVLLLNWLLLSAVYLWVLWGTASRFGDVVSSTMFIALGLLFAQSLVLLAVAMLFSSFSTTSLAMVMTVGCYLIGNNVSQVRLVAERTQSTLGRVILEVGAFLVPNLEYFNLGNKVTYAIPVASDFVLVSLAYSFVVTCVCLGFAGLLIRFREG